MSEPLWTCIATCAACGAVINTAEHVPVGAMTRVALGAPLVAFCARREHNTFSDINYNLRLQWVEEEEQGANEADAEAPCDA